MSTFVCFPYVSSAGCSCGASSAFNVHLRSHIHPLPEVSVYLLLTVHCVISGSFQCETEICKSALLFLSISDRIILKQRAACLPVCPLLLPQLIRLTEALHIWPQQLFQAFLRYHDRPNTLSIRKPAAFVKYLIKSEDFRFQSKRGFQI